MRALALIVEFLIAILGSAANCSYVELYVLSILKISLYSALNFEF